MASRRRCAASRASPTFPSGIGADARRRPRRRPGALAAIPEPAPPPPEVVAREITIGQQIAVLRAALAGGGRVLLQTILARCRSRTEAAVTFLATLELVGGARCARAGRAVRPDRRGDP